MTKEPEIERPALSVGRPAPDVTVVQLLGGTYALSFSYTSNMAVATVINADGILLTFELNAEALWEIYQMCSDINPVVSTIFTPDGRDSAECAVATKNKEQR